MNIAQIHFPQFFIINFQLQPQRIARWGLRDIIRLFSPRKSTLNDYLADTAKAIWNKFTCSSEMKPLKDIVKEIITGKTPPTKQNELYGGPYPFVTIPDMHNSVWTVNTDRTLSDEGNLYQIKKLVDKGTVLVSCIATVGLVSITSQPSHFNQQINGIIPCNKGEEFFLYFALTDIEEHLKAIGSTGSATLNINRTAFSNIKIKWISANEMKKYVSEVKGLFSMIRANLLENYNLQTIRDELLPKLMTGEIDVSKIEVIKEVR